MDGVVVEFAVQSECSAVSEEIVVGDVQVDVLSGLFATERDGFFTARVGELGQVAVEIPGKFVLEVGEQVVQNFHMVSPFDRKVHVGAFDCKLDLERSDQGKLIRERSRKRDRCDGLCRVP